MFTENLKGCEFLLVDEPCEKVFTPEDFSDEQRQMAETTEQFVENEVKPQIDEIETQNFDKTLELFRMGGELGLLMVDGPEEYGGLELDKVSSMLVAEKIGAAGSFTTTFIAHSGIGTLPLVYYGTAEQKERYLEGLLTGEKVGAYCLTEPGAGSDALGAKTSATLSEDGKYYILNGTKQFITNAGFADLFTVFARVDKEHFTGFLVEKGFEGVSVGPEEKKLGIKGSSTCQVIFDNAKVPVENLLGEIGKGHKIAFNVLNIGRFKLGATTTGAAKEAFQHGVKYSLDRKQFNQPICSFGAIKEKIANMTTGIFVSEALVYRIAGLIDNNLEKLEKGIDGYYDLYQKGIEDYAVECAISKVYCSEVLAYVTDEVIQIMGGYGFTTEYPAERFYRDERICRIFEGTNEINRLIVPGTVLAKGMKGQLPLLPAIKDAVALLSGQKESEVSGRYQSVKQLLQRSKAQFLAIGGTAAEKYHKALQQEQEVLIAMADIANEVFALESAVLRAEKSYDKMTASKQELLDATILVAAFNASSQMADAALRAASYLGDANVMALVNKSIYGFDATGLLEAKRKLADASLEAEKYIFD